MTVTDRVFESVRSDILAGKIPRDSLLSIYQLANQYQVSRTPAREAVLRLESLGLVTIEKNHGVRVKGLTACDVRDIFRTRLLIEVPAAFHAAQTDPPGVRERFAQKQEQMRKASEQNNLTAFMRADRDLHDMIIGWTGNRRATKIVAQIRDETHALGASTFGEGRSPREVLAEHLSIYEAIDSGDAVGAATAMRSHLEKTAQILLLRLSAPERHIATIEQEHPIVFIEL